MSDASKPVVKPDREQDTKSKDDLEPGYLVVCWNDPVNFMDYVTHVFQKVFGWQRQKAELHMMQVPNYAKSVLGREGLDVKGAGALDKGGLEFLQHGKIGDARHHEGTVVIIVHRVGPDAGGLRAFLRQEFDRFRKFLKLEVDLA